jgi:hypothetical protein
MQPPLTPAQFALVLPPDFRLHMSATVNHPHHPEFLTVDHVENVVLLHNSSDYRQRKTDITPYLVLTSLLHTLSHLHKSRRVSNRCSFFAGAAG